MEDSRVTINVCGTIYETKESTLDQFPETILGTAEKRSRLLSAHYNKMTKNREIFFNRNRNSFENILFFYQSRGKLIRPITIPMQLFIDECAFFGISDRHISVMKDRESVMEIKQTFHGDPSPRCHSIWLFVNMPRWFKPSGLAFCYTTFSYVLVVTSVLIFCFEKELKTHVMQSERFPNILENIEVALNVFFASEFFVRLTSSPSPMNFLGRGLNILEMISIYPYFIVHSCPKSEIRQTMIYILRVIRIVRLYRLGRISTNVRAAGRVAKACVRDMMTVLVLCVLATILSASLLYLCEVEHNPDFNSIPNSMWWAWQTMFCLGYGDIVPQTVLGKTVASLVAVFGIVIMAVLILSLGGRSFELYNQHMKQIRKGEEDSRSFGIQKKL